MDDKATSGGIATFYSFKGGGGRSMALANVAWALASNGMNVLAVDWDLEAPGLHRYFHPFLADPEQARSLGLVDRFWRYAKEVGQDGEEHHATAERLADCSDLIQTLELPKAMRGTLSFIGSGKQDESYTQKVGGLDWGALYRRFGGSAYFDAFGRWARQSFDMVLIDSRTGVSDSAGVCTVQLPDIVVLTFVYNRQSIDGTAAVARSINFQRAQEGRPVTIIPTPARVEGKPAAAQARRYAAARLRRVCDMDVDVLERELKVNEIPHYSWCAFEEKLAVFEDDPKERSSLLREMHGLASRLVDRPIDPVTVDRGELDRLWRRAAFADPRLADLAALKGLPLAETVPSLCRWAKEALAESDDRADWRSTLAATCVEVSQIQSAGSFGDQVEFLSKAGVELARRWADTAVDSEARSELGRLLLIRANFLQAQARPGEAVEAVAEATSALSGGDATDHMQLARALEWQADVLHRIGDRDGAVANWTNAAANFRRAAEVDPNRRDDASRTTSKLAVCLDEKGDREGALTAAQQALSDLQAGEEAGAPAPAWSWASARVVHGRILLEAGCETEARQEIAEAKARLGPRCDDDAHQLAWAGILALDAELLGREGRLTEARRAAREAIELRATASRDVPLRAAFSVGWGNAAPMRLLVLEAELFARGGDHSEAIQAAERALKAIGGTDGMQPHRLRLLGLLVSSNAALGRLDAADRAAAGALLEVARMRGDEVPTDLRNTLRDYARSSASGGRGWFADFGIETPSHFLGAILKPGREDG